MIAQNLKKFYLFLTVLAVVALCGAAAPSVKADSYDFSLTNGTNTIDFQFPTTFTPDAVSQGNYFMLNSVTSYTLNGIAQTAVPVSFWSAATGGGFILGDFTSMILNQGGSQLYTGTEAAPTGFTFGTYNMTDWGSAAMGGDYTLTLTDPPSSVPAPEPSSLLMLGVGLFAMGGMIARQQKKRQQATEAA